MDTQAIGAVSANSGQAAPAPAPAPAVRAPSTTAVKSAEAVKEASKQAEQLKAAKQEVDVRTRDPRSLQYQVDGNTKQVVATIVDESNKLVVRQIPDAEVLRIAQAIDRMKGFLLEGKA